MYRAALVGHCMARRCRGTGCVTCKDDLDLCDHLRAAGFKQMLSRASTFDPVDMPFSSAENVGKGSPMDDLVAAHWFRPSRLKQIIPSFVRGTHHE
jgi:hypothetical protein